MDTAFRKIDIDALDEDKLLEDELYVPDPRDPATVLADAKSKTTQVRTALSKGDTIGALHTILADFPYGPNVDDAKSATLSAVLLILNSTKSSDIPNILRSLAPEEHDTLMKYIYKGMGSYGRADADVSGSVLLSWHEKVTEVAGTGCIVRVMSDRRTV